MIAGSHAGAAMCTEVFLIHELPGCAESLRVMAPPASKGTAFEKHGNPGPWAIMNRELPDIKYSSVHITHCIADALKHGPDILYPVPQNKHSIPKSEPQAACAPPDASVHPSVVLCSPR